MELKSPFAWRIGEGQRFFASISRASLRLLRRPYPLPKTRPAHHPATAQRYGGQQPRVRHFAMDEVLDVALGAAKFAGDLANGHQP